MTLDKKSPLAHHATWGGLPPRVRMLYVAARQGMGASLAATLAADSASRVHLDEAVGSTAALAALREQIYDAVLVSHRGAEEQPPGATFDGGVFDGIAFVEGLRAGGGEEPVIVLGHASDPDLADVCYEVGADAYLPHDATIRTFLWTLARAIERHRLIGENRRLAQVERNRAQQEQRETERLLAAQRGVVEQAAAAAREPGHADADQLLPERVRQQYRDLLRAHVMMGCGNLSSEMSLLAAALAQAQVPAHQALALHVEAVETLVRGLGSRSARHVITRADLLVCELLVALAECHRTAATLTRAA